MKKLNVIIVYWGNKYLFGIGKSCNIYVVLLFEKMEDLILKIFMYD